MGGEEGGGLTPVLRRESIKTETLPHRVANRLDMGRVASPDKLWPDPLG